jgi:hypothetical protein
MMHVTRKPIEYQAVPYLGNPANLKLMLRELVTIEGEQARVTTPNGVVTAQEGDVFVRELDGTYRYSRQEFEDNFDVINPDFMGISEHSDF